MGVSFRSDYRIENTSRVAGCSHCVRHLGQVREGRPHRSRKRPAPVRASFPPLRARDVPPCEPGLGRANSRRGNGKLIPGHSLTRRCSGLASLATELHSLGFTRNSAGSRLYPRLDRPCPSPDLSSRCRRHRGRISAGLLIPRRIGVGAYSQAVRRIALRPRGS